MKLASEQKWVIQINTLSNAVFTHTLSKLSPIMNWQSFNLMSFTKSAVTLFYCPLTNLAAPLLFFSVLALPLPLTAPRCLGSRWAFGAASEFMWELELFLPLLLLAFTLFPLVFCGGELLALWFPCADTDGWLSLALVGELFSVARRRGGASLFGWDPALEPGLEDWGRPLRLPRRFPLGGGPLGGAPPSFSVSDVAPPFRLRLFLRLRRLGPLPPSKDDTLSVIKNVYTSKYYTCTGPRLHYEHKQHPLLFLLFNFF